MPRAKGTALISAVRFLRSQRQQAATILPASLHHYLHERVLESLWYPEEDCHALICAVAELLPMERSEALIFVGRAAVAADLQDGRYHGLHHASDVSGLPRRVFALWATQHDTGEMRMVLAPDGSGLLTLAGYAAPSREMCTLLIGYADETLRATGFQNPAIRKTACVLDGAPRCEWTSHNQA